MHDIRSLRDDPAGFDAGLARRGLAPRAAELLALDDARRTAIAALQQAQERRNAASKEIGAAMARKDAAAAEAVKAEVAALKQAAPALEAAEKSAQAALDEALAAIPNIPAPDTPDGRDENDNVEVRRHGEPAAFPAGFKPKEHFELGEALGLMDFETAAKLSGARFVILKGALARLERALMQFMLDLHTTEHGYTEINPPVLVSSEAMFGTAQLPKFREDQFGVVDGLTTSQIRSEFEDLIESGQPVHEMRVSDIRRVTAQMERRWLIPTAEVPMTNMVREQILDERKLPLRFTAGTLCFRAEAGAAGRDTRGMIRQHQFEKVELVSITTPEQSAKEHEDMTKHAEEVLKRLGLHFRTVVLCAGDMGFS
ncbi:MAG: serine--tRNA ligase, partial [Pseudomonadota bacterium]|nr:serine--tRNA ligase [Pseudomonadota bacterium]